jgi:hypothetical protein
MIFVVFVGHFVDTLFTAPAGFVQCTIVILFQKLLQAFIADRHAVAAALAALSEFPVADIHFDTILFCCLFSVYITIARIGISINNI